MMFVDLDRGRSEGIALAKTLADLDAGRPTSIDLHDDSEDEVN